MILFYDRFDKTAIQIQLLKDQLQLTLVRRPAEQVGKGSCKSRSSKVEGNFEITWNGEKIIFACLFEFCSFIIMIDHDNVSRPESLPFALQAEIHELPETANICQQDSDIKFEG